MEFKSIPVLRMASLKADVCELCFLFESTFSVMSYGGFLLLCAHYSTEYKHWYAPHRGVHASRVCAFMITTAEGHLELKDVSFQGTII